MNTNGIVDSWQASREFGFAGGGFAGAEKLGDAVDRIFVRVPNDDFDGAEGFGFGGGVGDLIDGDAIEPILKRRFEAFGADGGDRASVHLKFGHERDGEVGGVILETNALDGLDGGVDAGADDGGGGDEEGKREDDFEEDGGVLGFC